MRTQTSIYASGRFWLRQGRSDVFDEGQKRADMSPSTHARDSESCDAAQSANIGRGYGYLFQLARIEMQQIAALEIFLRPARQGSKSPAWRATITVSGRKDS